MVTVLLLGKVLLMLQSIKRGYSVDSTSAHLHTCLMRFYKYVEQNRSQYPETVQTVLQTEMKKIYNDKSPTLINEEFLLKNSNSLLHRYHGM